MSKELIIERCQKYLENVPTIIVGSGASVPYGLPTMRVLGSEIKTKLCSKYSGDKEWDAFIDYLDSSENLEQALNVANVTDQMVADIIIVTWNLINRIDKEVFQRVYKDNMRIQISRILDRLLQSHPREVNIITANYDRLIEYASDSIRANVNMGFSGSYIRHFKGIETNVCPRTINLCKVHGSLDWFRRESNKILISLQGDDIDTNEFFPVIVTPGFKKYLETHLEPYRTLIVEADKYIEKANSFLCIGYGFNDEHLQPKLIERIQSYNKPIVIVTHTLSEKGKEILHNSKRYIAFEYCDESNTRVISDQGEYIIEGDYWKLEKFIDIWLGE